MNTCWLQSSNTRRRWQKLVPKNLFLKSAKRSVTSSSSSLTKEILCSTVLAWQEECPTSQVKRFNILSDQNMCLIPSIKIELKKLASYSLTPRIQLSALPQRVLPMSRCPRRSTGIRLITALISTQMNSRS